MPHHFSSERLCLVQWGSFSPSNSWFLAPYQPAALTADCFSCSS